MRFVTKGSGGIVVSVSLWPGFKPTATLRGIELRWGTQRNYSRRFCRNGAPPSFTLSINQVFDVVGIMYGSTPLKALMNEPVVATSECAVSQEFSFVFAARLIYLCCYFSYDCMKTCVMPCWCAQNKNVISKPLLHSSNIKSTSTFTLRFNCSIQVACIALIQVAYSFYLGYYTIGSLWALLASLRHGAYNKQASVCICDLFWLRYPFSSLAERDTVCHLHPCSAAQMWLSRIPAPRTSSCSLRHGFRW